MTVSSNKERQCPLPQVPLTREVITHSLLNLLEYQEALVLKLHTMILNCVNKSFKAIPHLFICMRQLKIIEYVQRQRTAKASNMESFNMEKLVVDRFKGELRPKNHPCFYVIILMTLWKKSLVQSFAVLLSVLMKLRSYKVLNPASVT